MRSQKQAQALDFHPSTPPEPAHAGRDLQRTIWSNLLWEGDPVWGFLVPCPVISGESPMNKEFPSSNSRVNSLFFTEAISREVRVCSYIIWMKNCAGWSQTGVWITLPVLQQGHSGKNVKKPRLDLFCSPKATLNSHGWLQLEIALGIWERVLWAKREGKAG